MSRVDLEDDELYLPEAPAEQLRALRWRLAAYARDAATADSRLAAEQARGTTERARARMLQAVSEVGRFARFAPAVAELADVSEARAGGWLDVVWGSQPRWEPATPDARAWWVQGGRKAAGALRGFVHLGAGSDFPRHAHLGAEHVLILQGSARLSSGQRLRPGDRMTTGIGEEHSFEAIAGGPDLLLFTVVFGGLDFGSFVALPRE